MRQRERSQVLAVDDVDDAHVAQDRQRELRDLLQRCGVVERRGERLARACEELEPSSGRELSIRDVANDRGPADHPTVARVEWRVDAFVVAAPARFGNRELALCRTRGAAGEGLAIVEIRADLEKKRKHLERDATDHLRRSHPRDALHHRVPRRVATLGVEGQDAVAAAAYE